MTRKTIEAFLTGLGITALVTLGAALVSLGPTEDIETWGRNLLLAEAGAIGAFLVNHFRGYLPAPPPETLVKLAIVGVLTGLALSGARTASAQEPDPLDGAKCSPQVTDDMIRAGVGLCNDHQVETRQTVMQPFPGLYEALYGDFDTWLERRDEFLSCVDDKIEEFNRNLTVGEPIPLGDVEQAFQRGAVNTSVGSPRYCRAEGLTPNVPTPGDCATPNNREPLSPPCDLDLLMSWLDCGEAAGVNHDCRVEVGDFGICYGPNVYGASCGMYGARFNPFANRCPDGSLPKASRVFTYECPAPVITLEPPLPVPSLQQTAAPVSTLPSAGYGDASGGLPWELLALGALTALGGAASWRALRRRNF